MSQPFRLPPICFERTVPSDWVRPRLPASAPVRAGINSQDRLAALTLKTWPVGFEIRCRFLYGTEKQRRLVQRNAQIWEQFANIVFRFVPKGDAAIRISFDPGQGSWSAVGTDALCGAYYPAHQPTMNFGWLDDDTPEDEYRRVVLHEFGHALGFLHEHQSPRSALPWDVKKVYAAYKGPPNYWSEEDIDYNILNRDQSSDVIATDYDLCSIMLYSFDESLFLEGTSTPFNTTLSDRDKLLAGQLYPFPST